MHAAAFFLVEHESIVQIKPHVISECQTQTFMNSMNTHGFWLLICDRQVNSNIRHDQRSNSQSNKDFFFRHFMI